MEADGTHDNLKCVSWCQICRHRNHRKCYHSNEEAIKDLHYCPWCWKPSISRKIHHTNMHWCRKCNDVRTQSWHTSISDLPNYGSRTQYSKELVYRYAPGRKLALSCWHQKALVASESLPNATVNYIWPAVWCIATSARQIYRVSFIHFRQSKLAEISQELASRFKLHH